MADKSSTIENVLNKVTLPDNGRERVKKFYESRNELKTNTAVNLKKLKEKVENAESLDAKIVALIVQLSGLETAKGTPAWSHLNEEEKHVFESHNGEFTETSDVNDKPLGSIPNMGESKRRSNKPNDKLSKGEEGGHENEVTSLRREITNMLKKETIGGVPGSAKLIAEHSKQLAQPGITAEKLKIIRDSLHDLEAAVSKFEPKNAQDIIDKINNYNESRAEKTNEGNMLLYSAIVHELYRLGFHLSFGRGNSVRVTGGNGQDAANLTSAFLGKNDVIEWLKRGSLVNTSQWTGYMKAYPSRETATVDKYISTYGEDNFAHSAIDRDFLSSSHNGGFDVMGPDGKRWVPRGMNIHSVAESAQQAVKKFEEMGYRSPMQKAGGKTVQFAELALNVAKFGFAAASVWKGTKALWKTIFGDEAGMKAAWGDFGKTLAWTGAVWYGSDTVKEIANDVKSSVDVPNYRESIIGLSAQEGKSGMIDGFEAVFNKVGRGYIPGMFGTAKALELLSDGVPAHQFTDMWETLITGRRGDNFLNANISHLSNALNNSYHTKSGSHVGGVKEFFLDMGSWGKSVYDKYFINPTTADAGRKFLYAIADYRSEDSFAGANDAVSDRGVKISTLFATQLTKKTEVPMDLDPQINELKEQLRGAGISIVQSGIRLGTLGATGVRVVFDGIGGAFDIATDTLKNLTPGELAVLKGSLAVLGLGLGAAGISYGISLIPGFGALKVLAITGVVGAGGYGIYKLIDTTRGLINDPEKLVGYLKQYAPDALRRIITTMEAARASSVDILNALNTAIASMPGIPDWVKKSIASMLNTAPANPGAPAPAPGVPPGTPPSPPSGPLPIPVPAP